MRPLPTRLPLALLTGLTLTAAPASAQTVQGILMEHQTYTLIELGTVIMIGEDGDTVAMALTDEQGLFVLRAPDPGTFRVQAHAFGYLAGGSETFELEEDGFRVLQLHLVPAPIPIPGVNVETEGIVVSDELLLANGFYERMMQGRGQFLAPEDIEVSPARYTPQLLRGLDYVRPQYGASGWKIWPELWSPSGRYDREDGIARGICEPRIYVDDVWVNREGYEQFEREHMGLEDVVPREQVKAMELYWGFQAPFKYRAPARYDVDPSADCGVLLIWTK